MTITDWLCSPTLGRRQFARVHEELASDPTETQILEALKNPLPEHRWREADAAVVYVTGHGMLTGDAHWLCLKSTEADRIRSTAMRTADLIGWLNETQVGHLMVLVDLCYAGAVSEAVGRFDVDLPTSWLALGSVTPYQEAKTNGLTGAIKDFLHWLSTDPSGQKYENYPYLKVQDFLEAVQANLEGRGQRLALLAPGLPSLAVSPCLPNPRYRPLPELPIDASRRGGALRPEDLAAHWGPRSRGIGVASDPGWLFKGRKELMRRLIEAATGEPEVLASIRDPGE